MQILFRNESDKRIEILLPNSQFYLLPAESRYVKLEGEGIPLTVSADMKSRHEPVTGKLGLSYFHHFVVTSTYTVTPEKDGIIRFYRETAHGNNFETYTRIYPFSQDCRISPPYYTVKNAEEMKEKIAKSDKNEVVFLQGASVAGKVFKAKNTLDDIIVGLIIGAIALVIFILIWIFKDFKVAASAYASIAIFGFLIWKLFLEKSLAKTKRKAQNKAGEKLGKMFLHCEDMPEGIFKSKDSYFDHGYINAVFVHSTKRV